MQILSREHEYSQKDSGSVSVKGRVKAHSIFWLSQLDCPDFVRNIISQGYCLPFSQLPEPIQLRNNRSALLHPDFVEKAITQLLEHGCVKRLIDPPTCVNPLTVAIGKKLRLVIDLRHVNSCLVKPKFHYEELKSLSKVFQRDFWFVTWDLQSGYHHADILRAASDLPRFLMAILWRTVFLCFHSASLWPQHGMFLFH